MNDQLRQMLDRMFREGQEFDSLQETRETKRRNLQPEAAKLISHLIRLKQAQKVVELGTSNGYSTVWFADAVADTGGRLTTVDLANQDDAIANVTWAGLNEQVDFINGDAGEALAGMPDASVDVLFMDSERPEYAGWWPNPSRVIAPGGVMVIDNIHSPAPDELIEYLALVEEDESLDLVIVPIGSGLGIALKR